MKLLDRNLTFRSPTFFKWIFNNLLPEQQADGLTHILKPRKVKLFMWCEKNNFSYLARNPDKKDFTTRATVSFTAIPGQNSYPPYKKKRSNSVQKWHLVIITLLLIFKLFVVNLFQRKDFTVVFDRQGNLSRKIPTNESCEELSSRILMLKTLMIWYIIFACIKTK